jgi:L-iditol 2-dehydrogenase
VQTDVEEYRLEAAKMMGADYVVNLSKEDVSRYFSDITKEQGINKVIEAVGGNQNETIQQAVKISNKGGLVVVIGAFKEHSIPFPLNAFRKNEITLKTSQGHPGAFPKCTELLDQDKVNIAPIITHRLNLDNAEEGLKLMAEKRDKAIKVILTPHG